MRNSASTVCELKPLSQNAILQWPQRYKLRHKSTDLFKTCQDTNFVCYVTTIHQGKNFNHKVIGFFIHIYY
jgi:hypothetical protein